MVFEWAAAIEDQVLMAVDQARQQRRVAEIEDLDIGRRLSTGGDDLRAIDKDDRSIQ